MNTKDDNCNNSTLYQRLLTEYLETGRIETSHLPRIESNKVRAITSKEARTCVIHDNARDIVHSYSITLYQELDSKNYFLVYEGGFGGADIVGYGPLK